VWLFGDEKPHNSAVEQISDIIWIFGNIFIVISSFVPIVPNSRALSNTNTPTPTTNVYFLNELRVAIRRDWNSARKKGLRSGAYSQSDFQQKLYDRYQEVGNNTMLKTMGQYAKMMIDAKKAQEAGENVEVPVKSAENAKVDCLLRYIYIDHRDLPWNEVTRIVNEFEGGIYLPRAAAYINARNAPKVDVPADVLAAAGANPNYDYYIQLLQLTQLAKQEHDKALIKLTETTNLLEMEKSITKELKEEKQANQERKRALELRIANLEGRLLGMTGEEAEALKRDVDALKKEINNT